ncbi:HTH-type transcriptional regulator BenM [Amycolatopsis sp. CA-230715]|nr:HTH-type transcriptional regulator BenM [Amycolatopsis sp. CA-230715]
MELRALRYFVTVAEELHFGRAAERLNIVQPAVSQQIARLERELGVRLLDRSPRTVRLTDAGHRALEAARDALAAAERVRTVVADHRVGTVRIGTAAGLTSRLERGIDELRRCNPSFEPVLVDLPAAARLSALRRGELDLALARGTVSVPGLKALPTWSEPLHAVVSTRHPAADREIVTIDELARYPLRFPARECDPPLYDAIMTALREAGVRPKLGRRAGTPQDTVVEIGATPENWALLPADQIAAVGGTRVRSIPLDPPVAITGSVVTSEATPEACVAVVTAAFRDNTP